MEDAPVFYGFKNIFITMFATFFFFKLLIKVSLALLTHFYIVKGNRKEAARIAEEIYGGISDYSGSTRYQWSYPRQSIKMLPLTGKSEKNFEVSGSIKWPGLWKAISFGDYICHTFQGDCWADRSPLHEAAAQGRLLALKTLISQGVNVNLMTINQVSSLHEACLGGHVACARVLLENGAQVNGVTVHGATPLFNACCNGSAACVSMLLEHGAKAQLDMHLCSPIHEAVKRGHIECMEILLANNVNIDQELPQLGTPLYVACTYEKENCLKKLLELGANPDQGQWLNTPLHAAARQSNLDIIYMLVDYGANLRLRNAQGKTPLDLAAPKSSVAEALILCEGPPTLSQLCRLRIRKCLGRTYRQTINQLHLPEPLERFLLYQ